MVALVWTYKSNPTGHQYRGLLPCVLRSLSWLVALRFWRTLRRLRRRQRLSAATTVGLTEDQERSARRRARRRRRAEPRSYHASVAYQASTWCCFKRETISRRKIHGCKIQNISTSISIVVKFEERLLEKLMKVTNIYKHQIVDTRAQFASWIAFQKLEFCITKS